MRKAFIISNNERDVEVIQDVIISFPNITSLEFCRNRSKALNIILKELPQIIFIDIDFLNDMSSFLLEIYSLTSLNPTFVAISSKKSKAFNAFKLGFFDYLLSQIDELSTRKCLLRYVKTFPIKKKNKLCLKSYRDYHYLDTDNILFLKADNNTTDFYMDDRKTICACKTLKTFENKLPRGFVRIHKSYIVNARFISRISYGKSVCLIKEHRIPFTKTFIHNVDIINNILSQNILALN